MQQVRQHRIILRMIRLEAIEANTLGTSNILQYACREKALGVLMISSLKVYGEVKNGKPEIEEEDLGYINIDDYYNLLCDRKKNHGNRMQLLCKAVWTSG